MNKLQTLYHVAAKRALADGCHVEGTSIADVERWVRQNVACRPDVEPCIVLGIASAIADVRARALEQEDEMEQSLAAIRPQCR